MAKRIELAAAFLACAVLARPARADLFPTAFEQYELELINRARANPNAEVTRLSVFTWGDTGSPAAPNLNEGLAAGTISATAKQPLAFNPKLIQAARDYSNALLVNDAFTHNLNGPTDTPGSRMTTAGYSFSPTPAGNGENLAVTASSGPLNITKAVTDSLYNGLFIDGDVAGRGHRLNLMNTSFREIGIGLAQDNTYTFLGAGFPNAVLTTEDFAFVNSNPFLTGVAFTDNVLADNFYTPGEGLGGITVNARNPIGGAILASTTTWGSGGYTLQLAPGTYNIEFVGGPTFNGIVIGAENVKLDLIAPVPEPATWLVMSVGLAGAVYLRRQLRRER